MHACTCIGEAEKSTEGGEGASESVEATAQGEENKEPKKMSFAERYAGPEGTTVTIKAAPQMPTFPGLPPMEGPSVSIRNPGGGKPPEAVVNFPMPPAFQLLRMMLRRAQQREKEEQEAAAKGESAEGESGASGEGEGAEKKPKKPRLVLRKCMYMYTQFSIMHMSMLCEWMTIDPVKSVSSAYSQLEILEDRIVWCLFPCFSFAFSLFPETFMHVMFSVFVFFFIEH